MSDLYSEYLARSRNSNLAKLQSVALVGFAVILSYSVVAEKLQTSEKSSPPRPASSTTARTGDETTPRRCDYAPLR